MPDLNQATRWPQVRELNIVRNRPRGKINSAKYSNVSLPFNTQDIAVTSWSLSPSSVTSPMSHKQCHNVIAPFRRCHCESRSPLEAPSLQTQRRITSASKQQPYHLQMASLYSQHQRRCLRPWCSNIHVQGTRRRGTRCQEAPDDANLPFCTDDHEWGEALSVG